MLVFFSVWKIFPLVSCWIFLTSLVFLPFFFFNSLIYLEWSLLRLDQRVPCRLCSVSCYGRDFVYPTLPYTQPICEVSNLAKPHCCCCFYGSRKSDHWPVVFWFNITPGQKLGVFSITSSSTDFKTCGWYTFLVSNPAESFLFPHFLNQPLVILLGILWGTLYSDLCSSWHRTRSFTSPPIETIKDRAFCCSFLFSLYTLFF